MRQAQRHLPGELTAKSVSGSLAAFGGWMVRTPRREAIELNFTTDQAIRSMINSGGVQPGAVLPGIPSESEDG